MPPDEAPKGELKYFFCEDGKETPINMPSMEPVSAEQMLKDIEQAFINTVESARQPVPTHVVGKIDCKPKQIKDFITDLQIQLATRQKYRNPKIPHRQRMIRRAERMKKYHFYVFCAKPAECIEMNFFYSEHRRPE